jgi:hypothetical protein
VVSELPGAEEISFDGLERVISVPATSTSTSTSGTVLHVFDGDNWLSMNTLTGSDDSIDTLGPLAVAFVAALNDAR